LININNFSSDFFLIDVLDAEAREVLNEFLRQRAALATEITVSDDHEDGIRLSFQADCIMINLLILYCILIYSTIYT
jgi:hypothetical protein